MEKSTEILILLGEGPFLAGFGLGITIVYGSVQSFLRRARSSQRGAKAQIRGAIETF